MANELQYSLPSNHEHYWIRILKYFCDILAKQRGVINRSTTNWKSRRKRASPVHTRTHLGATVVPTRPWPHWSASRHAPYRSTSFSSSRRQPHYKRSNLPKQYSSPLRSTKFSTRSNPRSYPLYWRSGRSGPSIAISSAGFGFSAMSWAGPDEILLSTSLAGFLDSEIPSSDACFVPISFPGTGSGLYRGTFVARVGFCGDLGSDCVGSGVPRPRCLVSVINLRWYLVSTLFLAKGCSICVKMSAFDGYVVLRTNIMFLCVLAPNRCRCVKNSYCPLKGGSFLARVQTSESKACGWMLCVIATKVTWNCLCLSM